MKFKYIFFIMYIMIFPFYFFNEGNPQIGDFFGVLIIIFNIGSIVGVFRSHPYFKFLFWFVIYTIAVNAAWMIILSEAPILKNSAYYLYSLLLTSAFFAKFKDEDFLRTISFALLFSLVLQVVLWPFIPDQGVRINMYFKNPNQLAFWSLNMLLISYITFKLSNIKGVLLYLVLLLSTFFIFISASKSGVAVAILFWMYFFTQTGKQVATLSMALILGLIVFFSTSNYKLQDFMFADNAIERLSERKRGQGNSLNDRGYDRIIDYPQYTVLGAGEGEVKRFNTSIELHSTIFNILFSYGLVGLALFGYSLFLILKGSNWTIKVVLVLIVLYSLAHMTLRSPFFWLCLTLLFYLNFSKSKDLKAL